MGLHDWSERHFIVAIKWNLAGRLSGSARRDESEKSRRRAAAPIMAPAIRIARQSRQRSHRPALLLARRFIHPSSGLGQQVVGELEHSLAGAASSAAPRGAGRRLPLSLESRESRTSSLDWPPGEVKSPLRSSQRRLPVSIRRRSIRATSRLSFAERPAGRLSFCLLGVALLSRAGRRNWLAIRLFHHIGRR